MKDKKGIEEKANFDFIRYANVWEDPEMLLSGLALKPGAKILSIASAGDNVLSLLLADPAMVIAADISQVQLFVLELKMASIQHLSYHEVLEFLGFRSTVNRKALFSRILPFLSKDAAQYFVHSQDKWLKTGLIHQGKFEKYFQLFSQKILPFIHNKRKISQLFEQKTAEEQRQFFQKKWNTWRWRSLFKLFFSSWVMGRLGRDPAFFNEVNVPVSSFILFKAEQQLASTNAQNNHFLRYNLTGTFGDLLPHYLRLDNFETIKSRLSRIQFFHGFAEDAVAQFGNFDAMNLSNIFEYMPQNEFEEVSNQLAKGLNPHGKMAYWNLMVKRRCSAASNNVYLKEQSALMRDLQLLDNGYFYDTIVIDEQLPVQRGETHNGGELRLWIEDKTSKEIIARGTLYFNGNVRIESESVAILGDYFCKPQETAAASALLSSATKEAKDRGFKRIIGPMNKNTWHSYRFKTKGDRHFLGELPLDTEAILAWKKAGFSIKDKYISSLQNLHQKEDSRLETRKAELMAKGVVFRSFEPDNWDEELLKIHALSLESFSQNKYYSPVDFEEFKMLYNGIKPILDSRWVMMAEKDNKLVGFVFAYLDTYDIDSKTLVLKTIARKNGIEFGGLGLIFNHLLAQKAVELGITQIIHAYMHEQAVSHSCSAHFQSEVISEYVLFAKSLDELAQ